ncbi:hypothetical protein BJ170DRAFT_606113 [Xylariales sp. AK1849]|nr:hypothetical protein BJ170DRAFT_606113 [Xylariales sp. AK1849]
MKTTILLTLLPLIAVGSPAADPAELVARDNVCTLYPGISSANCRSGPGTSYPVVRTITSSQTFGVRCVRNGWDWIPGWSCYVSRTLTNSGCESGLGSC